MSQITTKWITDGAITAAKLDPTGNFVVNSLETTADMTVGGNLKIDGSTIIGSSTFSDATINGNLVVVDNIYGGLDASFATSGGTGLRLWGNNGNTNEIWANSGYLALAVGSGSPTKFSEIDVLVPNDATFDSIIYNKTMYIDGESGNAVIGTNNTGMLTLEANLGSTKIELDSSADDIRLDGDTTVQGVGGLTIYDTASPSAWLNTFVSSTAVSMQAKGASYFNIHSDGYIYTTADTTIGAVGFTARRLRVTGEVRGDSDATFKTSGGTGLRLWGNNGNTNEIWANSGYLSLAVGSGSPVKFSAIDVWVQNDATFDSIIYNKTMYINGDSGDAVIGTNNTGMLTLESNLGSTKIELDSNVDDIRLDGDTTVQGVKGLTIYDTASPSAWLSTFVSGTAVSMQAKGASYLNIHSDGYIYTTSDTTIGAVGFTPKGLRVTGTTTLNDVTVSGHHISSNGGDLTMETGGTAARVDLSYAGTDGTVGIRCDTLIVNGNAADYTAIEGITLASGKHVDLWFTHGILTSVNVY